MIRQSNGVVEESLPISNFRVQLNDTKPLAFQVLVRVKKSTLFFFNLIAGFILHAPLDSGDLHETVNQHTPDLCTQGLGPGRNPCFAFIHQPCGGNTPLLQGPIPHIGEIALARICA